MTNNTGGPAFPQKTDITLSYSGMTLRDYFAAKAMQAMLQLGADSEAFEEDAEMSYQMADAMLRAREK